LAARCREGTRPAVITKKRKKKKKKNRKRGHSRKRGAQSIRIRESSQRNEGHVQEKMGEGRGGGGFRCPLKNGIPLPLLGGHSRSPGETYGGTDYIGPRGGDCSLSFLQKGPGGSPPQTIAEGAEKPAPTASAGFKKKKKEANAGMLDGFFIEGKEGNSRIGRVDQQKSSKNRPEYTKHQQKSSSQRACPTEQATKRVSLGELLGGVKKIGEGAKSLGYKKDDGFIGRGKNPGSQKGEKDKLGVGWRGGTGGGDKGFEQVCRIYSHDQGSGPSGSPDKGKSGGEQGGVVSENFRMEKLHRSSMMTRFTNKQVFKSRGIMKVRNGLNHKGFRFAATE